MKIKCRCGQENVTLEPFDDSHTEWIACTNACKTARQLRAEMAVKPVSERLSDAFPSVHLGLGPVGMIGH